MDNNDITKISHWLDSVDAVMREIASHAPQSFEHMDDLADYTLQRDGLLTARKVA